MEYKIANKISYKNVTKKSILENRRNYGIDLLRILSMFFIVTHHSLGHGGLLSSVELNSPQYKICWLLEIISLCGVNVFALISGYVSYETTKEGKSKILHYLKLWLQVVFYGFLITFIFNIFNPEIITKRDFISSLLPVLTNQYWYFTAYTGLFLLIPFLNKAIQNCSDIILKKLFLLIILIFSVLNTYTGLFNLENGYSFIWLILLYILGAIIKKCDIGKNVKTYKLLFILLFLYIITYILKIHPFEFKFNIFSTKSSSFMLYTSPTMLGISLVYVILFGNLRFDYKSEKIIRFFSNTTFAVYLLNDNNLVRKHIITNLFSSIYNYSVLKIFICIVGFSILFVIISMLIDKIRILLFKYFKINALIVKMSEFFNILISKIIQFI